MFKTRTKEYGDETSHGVGDLVRGRHPGRQRGLAWRGCPELVQQTVEHGLVNRPKVTMSQDIVARAV
jgi:hypothetical protein